MDSLSRTETVARRTTLTRRQRRAQAALALACIILGGVTVWVGINVAADAMDAHLDAVSPVGKTATEPASIDGIDTCGR